MSYSMRSVPRYKGSPVQARSHCFPMHGLIPALKLLCEDNAHLETIDTGSSGDAALAVLQPRTAEQVGRHKPLNMPTGAQRTAPSSRRAKFWLNCAVAVRMSSVELWRKITQSQVSNR